jgi:hypothetical protein
MPDLPNHLPIQPTPFIGREKEVACSGYLGHPFAESAVWGSTVSRFYKFSW